MVNVPDMPWMPHRLRDAEVWAKVDGDGALVTDRDGRVEIVYKPVPHAKVYRAGASNLTATAGEPVELDVGETAAGGAAAGAGSRTGATGAKSRGGVVAGVPADAIHVWTDGACTGNPGPAGLGVVIINGTEREEISEYLGEGTNNIAELTAILRGLEHVKVADRARPVLVYSDSAYSIGLLSQAWKAKKNVELVAELRALCREFADLRFVKVAGHAGIPLNERTDELAREAVVRRR
jgi:ribonuclease HI